MYFSAFINYEDNHCNILYSKAPPK